MFNEFMMELECERANEARNIYYKNTSGDLFFKNIKRDLLVTGKYACDPNVLTKMLEVSRNQLEMPVVILTSRSDLIGYLQELPDMRIYDEQHKEYHPLWGLDAQAILNLICQAAEEWGIYGNMDRMLLYAMAVMEIVNTKYILSLPAVAQILKESDGTIAQIVEENGLPEILADQILGNQEAGMMLRRVIEKLLKSFENIADFNAETQQNMLSAAWKPYETIVIYQTSQNQKLLNSCLKEELSETLKRVKKLRVIAIEPLLGSQEDELLTFLLDQKRIGKAELYLCSENAGNLLKNDEFNFTNVCMFRHNSIAALEKVSEAVFGSFMYHYPTVSLGKPPSIFYTFARDERLSISTEKRLCIRDEDLAEKRIFLEREPEMMAIKIGEHSKRYLTSIEAFGVKKNKNCSRRIGTKGGW